MDLGIAGRKAIVCASSKGLGRACARALAEAGCAVVLNGRDKEALERAARELQQATGVEVREILGDLDHAETRSELIAACPDADILVNNNGGPPHKNFGEISREDILKGIESNMLTPVALVQALAPGHGRAQIWSHHQHHLEFGAGAHRRPRRLIGRARWPHRLPRFRGEAFCSR
jgi:3-oxoacyl-[acyl-carrier protein] reductase